MLAGVTSSAPPPQTRRARLWRAAEVRHVPLRAILVTVAVVVLVYLGGKVVDRLRSVILLLVVAGFIALLLNPLVLTLQRWVGRRGIAVTVVTLAAVCAFAGLAIAFGYPLVNGISHLADNLPRYVVNVEHGKNWLGRLVTRYHLQQWVDKNAPKIASYGRDLASPALTLGKGALSIVFSLFTIFVLVILLLLESPKLRTGLLGLMTPHRASVTCRVAGEVNRSVTGFMLGNLATSLIAGLVVLLTLLLLGVPFPVLWALWVGLLDFLPMIGGALAGIPVVLFALTHSWTAGIVTAVVFLVYTQIENHVLNPVIMSKTVRINPLLVLVSILAGASLGSWVGGFFGGFVAALLAIPLAGAIQVIVREIWQATEAPGVPAATATGTGVAADSGRPDAAVIAATLESASGAGAPPEPAVVPPADPEPI
jgi:predicted PurR-regulated permease PerM